MTIAAPPSTSRLALPGKYQNAAEWLHALGDIPPERIIMDPWPGTATEAELLVFVERDKRLCELIDGTLVEKPAGYDESYIASLLITHLNNFVIPRKLGKVTGEAATLKMKNDRVRLPDVAFLSRSRYLALPKPTPPQVPSVGPDLVVEVLSPSNTKGEIDQKLREFFESGSRLAWVINPRARTAEVYHDATYPTMTLDEKGILDGEDVLPGFALPFAKLFEETI